MKRRMRIIVILAALAALGGGAILAYRYLRPAVDPSKAAVVRRGSIEATINTLGRTQPRRQLNLSTRANGRVKRILVREGDTVQAGALLLELEAPEYEDALQQAERALKVRRLQLEEALQAPSSSAIEMARARLRAATAARLKAQKDYDKITGKSGAESSDEALKLETAKLEYEIAKAEFDRTMEGATPLQVERLRADVQEAELALRQARERLGYTRIEAPFTGTIMSIEPRVGENVYGFNPLMRLADLSTLEIRAEVDEIDIAAVATGQRVQIRLDAFPTHVLKGQIARLMPGASDLRGSTTYGAIIEFDGEALPIRPGMGANLTITTRTVEDALLVPRRAIRQIGRLKVVQVLSRGRQSDVPVITGLSNDNETEILSGLVEGQVVLLN